MILQSKHCLPSTDQINQVNILVSWSSPDHNLPLSRWRTNTPMKTVREAFNILFLIKVTKKVRALSRLETVHNYVSIYVYCKVYFVVKLLDRDRTSKNTCKTCWIRVESTPLQYTMYFNDWPKMKYSKALDIIYMLNLVNNVRISRILDLIFFKYVIETTSLFNFLQKILQSVFILSRKSFFYEKNYDSCNVASWLIWQTLQIKF